MKEASIGIVFSPDKGQVLLVKRADIPVWVLPGGGIDEGETPEIAAKREIKEETGLNVSITRLAGVFDPTTSLTSRIHLFECSVIGGDLKGSDESIEVSFFPFEKLPKNLFILHQLLFWLAMDNPNKTLRQPLTQVTWWTTLLYLLRHPIWSISYLYKRFLP